jgi:hypothetical protein
MIFSPHWFHPWLDLRYPSFEIVKKTLKWNKKKTSSDSFSVVRRHLIACNFSFGRVGVLKNIMSRNRHYVFSNACFHIISCDAHLVLGE